MMAGTNIIFPECIICLSPLQSNLVTPVICGHVFHEECLKNWRNKGNNDNCPICKRDCSHNIKLIFDIKYCSDDDFKEEPQTLNELIMRNRILKDKTKKYEEEIKDLTEYNNKCQKTVEDFIKKVEENTQNMAKYKNEYLTLKCLLDEEKEKNQKNMEIIDKLKQEKNNLENFKRRFELKSEIDEETEKIILNKDTEKAQEDFEKQFYKLLNDDDENKGLREYFYVLQQKILKLTQKNEELLKEKKNNYAKERDKFNFPYNNQNATFTQLLQLSSNTKKRNYIDFMEENKIKNNNNIINKNGENNVINNNVSKNTDNNKNKNINEGFNIIISENPNNKRNVNLLQLKTNNNKKIFNNPLNKKELFFKKK